MATESGLQLARGVGARWPGRRAGPRGPGKARDAGGAMVFRHDLRLPELDTDYASLSRCPLPILTRGSRLLDLRSTV